MADGGLLTHHPGGGGGAAFDRRTSLGGSSWKDRSLGGDVGFVDGWKLCGKSMGKFINFPVSQGKYEWENI